MFNFNVFIITVFLCLSGCFYQSAKEVKSVNIAKEVNFKLIDLNKLGKNIEFNQYFQGSYAKNKYSVNLVTKISPDKAIIIGITSIGHRLFTIDYNNHRLNFTASKMIPKDSRIKPEYVLADMQLVYFPLVEIRRNISSNVVVKEGAKKRIFYKNNQPFIEIKYSSIDFLNSDISFKNLERKYEYIIKNIH